MVTLSISILLFLASFSISASLPPPIGLLPSGINASANPILPFSTNSSVSLPPDALWPAAPILVPIDNRMFYMIQQRNWTDEIPVQTTLSGLASLIQQITFAGASDDRMQDFGLVNSAVGLDFQLQGDQRYPSKWIYREDVCKALYGFWEMMREYGIAAEVYGSFIFRYAHMTAATMRVWYIEPGTDTT